MTPDVERLVEEAREIETRFADPAQRYGAKQELGRWLWGNYPALLQALADTRRERDELGDVIAGSKRLGEMKRLRGMLREALVWVDEARADITKVSRQTWDEYAADLKKNSDLLDNECERRLAAEAARDAALEREGEHAGIVQAAFSRWHAKEHDDVQRIEDEIMLALTIPESQEPEEESEPPYPYPDIEETDGAAKP